MRRRGSRNPRFPFLREWHISGLLPNDLFGDFWGFSWLNHVGNFSKVAFGNSPFIAYSGFQFSLELHRVRQSLKGKNKALLWRYRPHKEAILRFRNRAYCHFVDFGGGLCDTGSRWIHLKKRVNKGVYAFVSRLWSYPQNVILQGCRETV